MIYTVTLNPSLDYTMRLYKLTKGEVNRANQVAITFGGKGINVSVMLTELGIESCALGFVAGFTGDEIASLLRARGVMTDFIKVGKDGVGASRINLKLAEEDTLVPSTTEINASGPEISGEDIQRLYDKLDSIKQGDTVVLAGNIPPSCPSDIYKSILDRLAGRGVRFAVDATGSALEECLAYKPFLIKPNRDELEELPSINRKLSSDGDIIDAARALQSLGAVNVLVTLGNDGAILLDEHGRVHRQSALSYLEIDASAKLNTVGAGDSSVAGFLCGAEMMKTDPSVGYDHCLRLACAAGGATAYTDGIARADAVRALLSLA